MRPALLLAVLLLPQHTGLAQKKPASVDGYVRRFTRTYNIPGAAVSIVRNGNVVKAAGYGTANLELNVPVGAHSVFEIGSITKQFTAEAIMMLIELGKLGLDDPVSRYIPDLPSAWDGIHIRHLLTHTSGLYDWESDTATAFSLTREYTASEFITLVGSQPLAFNPGSRFAYTNSAYPLLGLVIERVSGIPYERFIRERIFTRAGMTETRIRDNFGLVRNRASGYADSGSVFRNGQPLRPRILAANGLILSTASDMARWMIALLDDAIVTKASATTMSTPTRLANGSAVPFLGIGWFLGSAAGHRYMAHNGSTAAGFSSVVYIFPDDALGVTVLLNIDRGDAVNRLATNIAAFYLPGVGMPAK
ncbi:MAG: serine hydrolase domain-containing protein [Gemmatimonadaceae bacterium]